MELPATLRHAVDQALEGIAISDLSQAAARLSQRYRAELRDGQFHVGDELAALAYLATRLPATYAAIRAALTMVRERLPDFVPQRQLDLGAGPGTALWAALDCWPMMSAAILLEGSAAIRRQGELLIERALPAEASGQTSIAWGEADLAHLTQDSKICGQAETDLVTLCYVLDELAPEARHRLIDWAWAHCTGVMLVVEPGTPAGWHRILAVRDQLIAAGGTIVAPCLHAGRCPLLPPAISETLSETAPAPTTATTAPSLVKAAPDSWCHFSRRVARSRIHRLAKQADVPWEDEKFIFIAVARLGLTPSPTAITVDQPAARIIAPVRGGGGRLQLQLCRSDGEFQNLALSKRDGDLYKRARRLDWGDEIALP